MAAMIGAAFMKLGRAPTTVRILMAGCSRSLAAGNGTLRVRDRGDVLNDRPERAAIRVARPRVALAAARRDPGAHVVDALEEDEASRGAEVPIDCPDVAAEHAVDRRAEGRG